MKATTGELCTWLDTFCEGTACAQVPLSQLLVVYDDLDLPTAAVRLRAKGGHGGHNGMRSIVQQLGGSNEFPRVRIGELIQRTALMLNFGLKDEYRIDSYQIQDYIEIQCLSESGKRNLQYICCMNKPPMWFHREYAVQCSKYLHYDVHAPYHLEKIFLFWQVLEGRPGKWQLRHTYSRFAFHHVICTIGFECAVPHVCCTEFALKPQRKQPTSES